VAAAPPSVSVLIVPTENDRLAHLRCARKLCSSCNFLNGCISPVRSLIDGSVGSSFISRNNARSRWKPMSPGAWSAFNRLGSRLLSVSRTRVAFATMPGDEFGPRSSLPPQSLRWQVRRSVPGSKHNPILAWRMSIRDHSEIKQTAQLCCHFTARSAVAFARTALPPDSRTTARTALPIWPRIPGFPFAQFALRSSIVSNARRTD
jgi:hypothetical protein